MLLLSNYDFWEENYLWDHLFKSNSSTYFLQGSEVLGSSYPSSLLQNNGFTSLHHQLFPKRFQYQHISNVMSHKTLIKRKQGCKFTAHSHEQITGEWDPGSLSFRKSHQDCPHLPTISHCLLPMPVTYCNWSSCCQKGLEKRKGLEVKRGERKILENRGGGIPIYYLISTIAFDNFSKNVK